MNTLFRGTDTYIADPALIAAVNAAFTIGRPLLIKGEPGTGKTVLAQEIAKALGVQLFAMHVKSTSRAAHGLYEYDQTERLKDAGMAQALSARNPVRADELDTKVDGVMHYIRRGPIWLAYESPNQSVLLIDEIDKADVEFPNDLLRELDVNAFDVYELQQTIRAIHRPLTIITSNNERELPDAFLRRCIFHYIAFPNRDLLRQIVRVHYPEIDQHFAAQVIDAFLMLRDPHMELKKRPATSELLDWIGILLSDQIGSNGRLDLSSSDRLPHLGALVKHEADLRRVLGSRGAHRV